MAKFVSHMAGLVLQDAKGIWAEFVDGVHETDDEAVAERLRNAAGVTEVEADEAAPELAKPAAPAEPPTPAA